MPLRILHVAPLDDNLASGLNRSIPALVAAQAKAGADVVLALSSSKRATPDIPGVALFALPSDASDFTGLLAGKDLAVFHSTYLPIHLRLAAKARKLGIPYIITPRGGMTAEAAKLSRWKKRIADLLFFRRFVDGAAAVHCLTEAEAATTRRWGRSVFVVGNGVELPLALEAGQRVVGVPLQAVYIGRLSVRHKGLDLLLDGFTAYQAQCGDGSPRIHLSLYGPDDGRGGLAYVRKRIAEEKLAGCVDYGGPIYGDEKTEVLREADMFCLTSRFEGHPNAVLEALAHGVPCLLTPGTNMADEVVEAGAGWKVAESVRGVCHGFKEAVNAATEILQMRAHARGLAAKHTWPKVAQASLEAYAEIIRK